jgi:hypothetical protein
MPSVLVSLLAALQSVFGDLDATQGELLSFVELFAGDESVSKGLRLLEYWGKSYDLRKNPDHDFLSPQGYLACMLSVLRCHRGAVCWSAPPCSTWVWLSRHSTGRSPQNIYGNLRSHYIRSQNALVTRLSLLLQLCNLRGVFYIIEQPHSTIMWDHPDLKRVLEDARHPVFRVDMDLGAWSLDNQKPTTLVGTAPWLPQLGRRMSQSERLALKMNDARVETAVKYQDKKGIKRCHGSAALKSTQSYSMNFGAAHALAFHKFVVDNNIDKDKPGLALQLEHLGEHMPDCDLPDSFDDIIAGNRDKWHNNKSGEHKLVLKSIA